MCNCIDRNTSLYVSPSNSYYPNRLHHKIMNFSTERKNRTRLWFGDYRRGLCALFVVLFDADTAFKLYLDAAGSYDDLFYQLLEYGTVIRVHDAAVADMLFEGVKPCFDLCVPRYYGFLFFLLRFQFLHPLAICLYLRCVVRCADAAVLFGFMQGEDGFLYLDDLLFDPLQYIIDFNDFQ